MRAEANRLGLRAIQNIIGGTRPVEIEIDGKRTICTTSQGSQEPDADLIAASAECDQF